MKSKRQVLADNPTYKTLINAVISRIGLDSVQDVNSGGIDGGFGGFVYNSDTHAFSMRYRKMIVRLLEETAEQLNQEVVEMVAGFGAFRRAPMDKEDRKELYQYLGGGKPKQCPITNLMAWFAAEEVCRMFED